MAMTSSDSGEAEITIRPQAAQFDLQMREMGEALAAFGQSVREAMAPTWAAFGWGLGDGRYCAHPGGAYWAGCGGPIATEADARGALAHARAATLHPGVHVPKALRRYAKARYLECRRVLGEAPLRGVRTNQFLST